VDKIFKKYKFEITKRISNFGNLVGFTNIAGVQFQVYNFYKFIRVIYLSVFLAARHTLAFRPSRIHVV
jgi:hypothetical protein